MLRTIFGHIASFFSHIPGMPPVVLLLGVLTLSFLLISSRFHIRKLLSRFTSDFRASIIYFVVFFSMCAVLPIVVLGVFVGLSPDAGSFAGSLRSLGITFGDYRLGLILSAIGVPLCILAGFIGSRDPVMQKMYPFSKEALRNGKSFATYMAAYFFLYYIAWEFVFRGVLCIGSASLFASVPNGWIFPLCLQTILSTVFHLGHPDSEITAAFAVGFVFGGIALATGSIVYPLILHASTGLATDFFLFRNAHKTIPENRRSS